ncbi:alpha/beta hydrolase [Caenimonas terrae]|uniref:Alpha/beta hydrolase n=1 Tax=Caenimonas terrae TaxID=696074 RepID=A0ABW0NA26_9BURK
MTRRGGLLAGAAALLSGCSGAGVLNAVAGSSHQGRRDIAYGPDPRQRLDVYRPAAQQRPAVAPIVVFFYGGSWSKGERADYGFVGEALASAGAIVVIPDYRLSPGVRYPDFVRDSAAAVKWAFDHAGDLGGSPDDIVVMGHSAGGYNAAMVALDRRWLQGAGLAPQRQLAGWIGLAGPYDFLPIGDRATQVAFRWPATAPDTQPINHVSGQAPRTLLLAAVNDSLVDPQRSTVGLGRALQTAGVPTRVELYPRVSHVTLLASLAQPLRWLAPVRAEVVAFLGLPTPA